MKSKPLIISITFLTCVLLGVASWMLTQKSPQLISEATSPDGNWSIAVVAKPRLIGSYEIVANIRDADGQVVNAFVIGLEQDPSATGDTYSVSFTSDEQAHIGELQRVRKADYFP